MSQDMTQKTQKSIALVWIVVSNLDQAVDYYTNTLGFTLSSLHKEFHWAEVKGQDGAILGLAEENSYMGLKAGINAIITYTVANIDEEMTQLKGKGVEFVGEMQEVPQTCKLQMAKDKDGNLFQLVQNL